MIEMESEEKRVHQEKMKKWGCRLVIFFVFMWICTIVSKSIYISRLPQVKAQTMEKKYVEHVVKVEGITVAGGQKAFHVLPGLRIEKLYVQDGDRVEAGTVLFCLDMKELAAVIEEKEIELAELKFRLTDEQRERLRASQERDVAVIWAMEDYEFADRETGTALERAEEELKRAEKELAEHLAEEKVQTSDSDREKAWDDYSDWKDMEYNVSNQIRKKEREIQDLEEKVAVLREEARKDEGGKEGEEV